MGEDSDNHWRIFDACPEPVEGAAMIFKLPPQFGQWAMSMSKTRLSSLAQLMRARDQLGINGWRNTEFVPGKEREQQVQLPMKRERADDVRVEQNYCRRLRMRATALSSSLAGRAPNVMYRPRCASSS